MRFVKGFAFAWTGLVEGARRDRNMRVHLGLGVLAGAFVALAPLSATQRAVLAVCIALVVAAESFNTALEAVVDLASPGLDERARIAKDAAAGAVLALAAGSVLAFVAVAAPHAAWIAARARALAIPWAGAAAAALAAALLPWPSRRPRSGDAVLAFAGIAGLLLVAIEAESHVGTAAAALCFAIGAGAARRRRS